MVIVIRIFDLVRNFFFFNDTATTEIYTLSLHDALPISRLQAWALVDEHGQIVNWRCMSDDEEGLEIHRSEEHTSELQSRENLVCRLLLEKTKKRSQKPQQYQPKRQQHLRRR